MTDHMKKRILINTDQKINIFEIINIFIFFENNKFYKKY